MLHLFLSLIFSLNFSVFAIPKMIIEGEFVKYDTQFIYIKNKGAKSLIKLPRKYALNSPTNIPKNFKMKIDVAVADFYRHNIDESNKLTRPNKIK